MNISKTLNGTSMTIALEGRLDTSTAPELEKVVMENVDKITALTLDFEKLSYISSAGLRVLLNTQKLLGEKDGLKLIHVGDVTREVFDVTGFSDILTIEE